MQLLSKYLPHKLNQCRCQPWGETISYLTRTANQQFNDGLADSAVVGYSTGGSTAKNNGHIRGRYLGISHVRATGALLVMARDHGIRYMAARNALMGGTRQVRPFPVNEPKWHHEPGTT
jgi:hypothetical protein